MFVTQDRHRFDMPEGLAEPRANYWRVVQLSMRTSWFLLTLKVEVEGLELLRSLAVSNSIDLLEVLRTLEPDRVAALTCVMPDSKAGAANWHSRPIYEVYQGTTPWGAPVLLYSDENGVDFVDDVGATAVHDVGQWSLVLKISSTHELAG